MNPALRRLAAAVLASTALALVILGLAVSARAQDIPGTTPAPAVVQSAENFATPFLVQLATAHPWIATVIALVGTLRLIAKPIVSAVEIYVKNSPSTADDALLEKVEHSLAWRVFFWVLDWGASVKIGSQFTAAPKQ